MSPVRRFSALCFVLSALAACGDDSPSDPGPDGTGSIEVTAVSAGVDLDADGYSIVVDGSEPVAIDANATATVTDAAASERTVSLTGIQANCAVEGENPRTVSVTTARRRRYSSRWSAGMRWSARSRSPAAGRASSMCGP